MKSTSGIALSVLLAIAANGLRAQEKPPEKRLPDAGQLQRDIERQELMVNLSDLVRRQERKEPDQPYEIQEGGIRLPADLCDRVDDKGCKPKQAPKR